jgi:hypothetical protein
VNLSVLPDAELEAVEPAIWYDDQQLGLGDDFLSELQQAYDHIRNRSAELSPLESYAQYRSCFHNYAILKAFA